MIIEKVDSNAALFSLDQSRAFDSVDHDFLEDVLLAVGFGLNFRSTFSMHRSHDGGERGKIESLYFVSINLSVFFALTQVLRPYVGTFPSQVKGKPGLTQYCTTWCCQC